MLQHRRRKKQQQQPTQQRVSSQSGVRSVELVRGKQGYGFTVSGQRPCALSNVVPGSPADVAGLCEGDRLLAVNGSAVAQLSHDHVVRLIAAAPTEVKLLVAEAVRRHTGRAAAVADDYTSDTSEDDDLRNRPSTVTPRHRPRAQSHGRGGAGRARSQSPGDALLRQATDARRTRTSSSKRQGVSPSAACMPAPAISGRASDFGAARSSGLQRRGDGSARALILGSSRLAHSSSVPDVSAHVEDATDAQSKPSYGAVGVMSAAASKECRDQTSLGISGCLQALRVVVGYIGTIEIPRVMRRRCSSTLQQQAVRSAVRRLRIEQKVHTLVALSVRPDGVRLQGPSGAMVAHYALPTLAMCGVYSDDERFFGLVTVHDVAARQNDILVCDRNNDDDCDGDEAGSSCHVFMVDPGLSQHETHTKAAQQFGISCTAGTSGCLEFPRTCGPVLRAVSALFRVSDSMGTPEAARYLPKSRSVVKGACYISGTDTDSDSGLGCNTKAHDAKSALSEAYVVSVDIPIKEDRTVRAASRFDSTAGIGARAVSNGSQLKDGKPVGGGLLLHASAVNPVVQVSATAVNSAGLRSTGKVNAATPVNAAVFNIRAKTDDSPLSQRSSAESIRRNMQKLMEARKTLVKDTHSLSDTESLASVRSTGSSFPPATISSPGNSDSSRATSSSMGHACVATETKSVALIGAKHLSSSCETLSLVSRPSNSKGARDHQASMPTADTVLPLSALPAFLPMALLQPPEQREGENSSSRRQPSKLSPRAYPELAARTPSVVMLSECSAFDKVTAHEASSWSQPQSTGSSVSAAAARRPVPAPRNPFSKVAPPANSTAESVHRSAELPGIVGPPDPRCYSVPPTMRVSDAETEASLASRGSLVGTQPKLNSTLAQLAKRWARPGSSLRKPRLRCSELMYAESLTDPQRDAARTDKIYGNTISINGTESSKATTHAGDIGRVTRWALGLDKLLQDQWGIAVFTDFLKKEHSEENIIFWLACERYSKASQVDKLAASKKIFYDHLSLHGIQPVNVDSSARQKAEEQLAAPTDSMFCEAQQQVFQLMKMDCYARFLKSDLYKNCIVADMEEHSISVPRNTAANFSGSKVYKDDASEEGSDASETRRSRSLFLFLKESAKALARNTDMLSRGRQSDADFLLKKQLAKQTADLLSQSAPAARLSYGASKQSAGTRTVSVANTGAPATPPALRLWHGTTEHSVVTSKLESSGNREEVGVMIVHSSSEDDSEKATEGLGSSHRRAVAPRIQQRQARRFVMPDGLTVVVGVESAADTMRTIVERLCSEHHISVASVDVLAVGSDKPLDLNKKLSDMDPGADFIMEKRAVFRLDLPKRKSVGVRAKPQRLVIDVLRPLLHKYGYSLDDVVTFLDGQPIAHDAIVSAVDRKRISVRQRGDLAEWGGQMMVHRSLSTPRSANCRTGVAENPASSDSERFDSCSDASSLDDVVDFEKAAFQERVRGSGLLSRLRPSLSSDERGHRAKSKNKVRFAPAKAPPLTSTDDIASVNDDDGSHLLDLITRAQGTQYNDQRGAQVLVGDLPAFLLQSSATKVDACVPPNAAADGRPAGTQHARLGATMQPLARGGDKGTGIPPASIIPSHDSLDNKLPPPGFEEFPANSSPAQHADNFHPGNSEPLVLLDSSFSTEGRLPSHEEAEALFTSAHFSLQGKVQTHANNLYNDHAVDDDRTPTRLNQSYRAAVLVADESDWVTGKPATTADDQSWYRPHWDARDTDRDSECSAEEDSALDLDRTLTPITAGLSADLPLTMAEAGYLPPPPAFENTSEVSVATAARPGLPPPYKMAVARSAALATSVASPALGPPFARLTRSSTLPGSRLSYAGRPLIIDDDDEGSALLQQPGGPELLPSTATGQAYSCSLVPGAAGHASEYGSRGRDGGDSSTALPNATAVVALQQNYGFYQGVQHTKQQYLNHSATRLSSINAAIQSTGSKITFV